MTFVTVLTTVTVTHFFYLYLYLQLHINTVLTILTSLLRCCHFFSVYCYCNMDVFVGWCWLWRLNLYVLVLFFSHVSALTCGVTACWCVCVCRCEQCTCACIHVHCVDKHTCWPDKAIGSKYIICTTVILWHLHGMLVVYTDIQYMEQNTTNCRNKVIKRSMNSLQFITTLKNTFLQRFICELCLVIPVILLKESRTQKTPKIVHEM